MPAIKKCGAEDYATLVGIWERSVRATHDFLAEETLLAIRRALIPEYFPCVELFAAIAGDGTPAGFIGLSGGDMIEMLFVDSDRMGQGYGSALIGFAMGRGATRVDVNEQNPSALRFYESRGFRVVGRDATDEAGRPHPILHMSL